MAQEAARKKKEAEVKKWGGLVWPSLPAGAFVCRLDSWVSRW